MQIFDQANTDRGTVLAVVSTWDRGGKWGKPAWIRIVETDAKTLKAMAEGNVRQIARNEAVKVRGTSYRVDLRNTGPRSEAGQVLGKLTAQMQKLAGVQAA